ncbi:MAG: hypothetical protein O7G85_05945, partial [Planctomycetota bacterium]|nr:hypothetical protein [Planctomycetota bacterium]
MTEIGGYQIDQPLCSDGLVTTYLASKDGSKENGRFHLKIYKPPGAIAGTPRAALDTSKFLEVGRRLQVVAKGSSSFISVKALGHRKGCGILVTTAFDYTLQSLIDARIHLEPHELRH